MNNLDALTEAIHSVGNPHLALEVAKWYHQDLSKEQWEHLRSVIFSSKDTYLVYEFMTYDDDAVRGPYEDYFIKMEDDEHLYSLAIEYIDADIVKIAEAIAKFGSITLIRKFGDEFDRDDIDTILADAVIHRGNVSEILEVIPILDTSRDKLLNAIVAQGKSNDMLKAMTTLREGGESLTERQDEVIYNGIKECGEVKNVVNYAKYLWKPCEAIHDFVMKEGTTADVLEFALRVKWSNKYEIEDYLIEHGDPKQLALFAKFIPEANKKKIWQRMKQLRKKQNEEYQIAKMIFSSSKHPSPTPPYEGD